MVKSKFLEKTEKVVVQGKRIAVMQTSPVMSATKPKASMFSNQQKDKVSTGGFGYRSGVTGQEDVVLEEKDETSQSKEDMLSNKFGSETNKDEEINKDISHVKVAQPQN